MTNQEWRRCNDPVKMIQGLKGIASDRKSILYLCGGCRCIWNLLYDDRSKFAVEVAERYADGLANREELGRASWLAECPTFGFDFQPGEWRSWECYKDCVPESVQNLAYVAQVAVEKPRFPRESG